MGVEISELISIYLSIAEIAGVFVGFGALISLTKKSDMEENKYLNVTIVVTIGLLAIVTALFPIVLTVFGLTPRHIWLCSALALLVLNLATVVFAATGKEDRERGRRHFQENRVVMLFSNFLLTIPLNILLVLIILGVFTAYDAAMYTAALVIFIFEAALMLSRIVFSSVRDG